MLSPFHPCLLIPPLHHSPPSSLATPLLPPYLPLLCLFMWISLSSPFLLSSLLSSLSLPFLPSFFSSLSPIFFPPSSTSLLFLFSHSSFSPFILLPHPTLPPLLPFFSLLSSPPAQVEVKFPHTKWDHIAQSLSSAAAYEFQGWARTVTYAKYPGAYTLSCQGTGVEMNYFCFYRYHLHCC